jgi:hypothetical protein
MRSKINKRLCLCKSLGVTNENSETLTRVAPGEVSTTPPLGKRHAPPQPRDGPSQSYSSLKAGQLAIASLDGHGSAGAKVPRLWGRENCCGTLEGQPRNFERYASARANRDNGVQLVQA